jgi:ABC-type multidrug transport system ATPase subunit
MTAVDDDHEFISNHSFAVMDPIDLVWKDTRVRVGTAELLHGVTGRISEGLIAIMGPSGSGKTTLLNCLSCRLDPRAEVTGELRINGESYTTSKLKKFLGYVMQDDIHNPLLTVRETLQFVAEARLGHRHTPDELATMVQDAMKSLSLVHCADSLIGVGNDGISGGEKKRLSVAIELLSRPKMLFLDEPTSNLDSLDALHFIRSLRDLVRETHCVVVCTIHQPQFKVFQLFDRLIMLRSGDIVYDGGVNPGVLDFCRACGKPCPSDVNPADHIMEVISPDLNDSFNTEAAKRQHILGLYRADEVDINRGAGRSNMQYLREGAPFMGMLKMSMHRSMTLIKRRRNEFIINALITVVNAFLVGLVFLRIGNGPSSTAKRLPALFFCIVNQCSFGAVSSSSTLNVERASIMRDRASGHISALSYYAGKILVELLVKLPFPIVFSIITYFLIGFQESAGHFFKYLAAVVLSHHTGIGVALVVSSIARSATATALALPLFMELGRLFGGYFIPLAQLPPGLRWINYISYIFYGFNSIAHNEMDDLVLVGCTPPSCTAAQGTTLTARGQDLGYNDSVGILVAYAVICLVVSYLAIRFLKH